MEQTFAIAQTTRGAVPRLAYEKMKHEVLGETYELSLTFVANDLMRRLNRTYRGKDYPTNVLAFPLAKDAGEIFINVPRATREARAHQMSLRAYVAFLFIHGMLHLSGHAHGSTMERQEHELLRAFGFTRPVF